MKFQFPISLVVPTFLLCFTIPGLLTSCKPARTVPVVYTISGDISRKNLFPVKETVLIHNDTTVGSLVDQVRKYNKKPFSCGVYFQKEGDNTRIKFVFLMLGVNEDIPEYNEAHWQWCFIGGRSNSTPCENDSKQRPTDTGNPSNVDNPEFVGSSITHYKRYVLVPLVLEKGNMYLDGEKMNTQTLKEMFSDYKICIEFHFNDKNDYISPYWSIMKQATMLAQGRFTICVLE